MSHSKSAAAQAEIQRLIDIMALLRDPERGCPWDIEQDFASITPYTIEEAHEVADAIAREAWDELPGELGDLLLQVVFHAQMAAERGMFDFATVAKSISDKLIARHPHVFGNESRDKSAAQQVADWETIKAAERARGGKSERPTGALDGVALGLPALTRALKLQNRAARVGFDWPSTGPVLDKITEEARELREAAPEDQAEEYGDLLFVMVNLGRHMGLDPEAALRAANAKFSRRFAFIEAAVARNGRTPSDSDLTEMDALWDAAKRNERGESV